jgi:alpha-glucosidase (family GH31 glycosyl hydrolase)
LIGKQILVAPVVEEGKTGREVYFPGEAEDWYQFEINPQYGRVQGEKVRKFSGKTR